jgi:CheY-like chemotaxis protein
MARILIAEDEPDIRDLITFTLRYAGHEVIATANGEEAFFKSQEVNPDLIMMDVRMPKMTGYEACRKMKEIDALKPIPVIFLSAKGQESEVQAGLEAGAVEYILKPFAPDQLTGRVNAILDKFSQPQAQTPVQQPPQATPSAGQAAQPAQRPAAPQAQPPQQTPTTPRIAPPTRQPQQPPTTPPTTPAQTSPRPPQTTPPSTQPQQPQQRPGLPPAQTPQTARPGAPSQTSRPAQTPATPPTESPAFKPEQPTPSQPPAEEQDQPGSIWRQSYRRPESQSQDPSDKEEEDGEKKKPRWPF